jgi:hypothetical protein
VNALIRVPLAMLEASIASGRWGACELRATEVDLGAREGAPLSFTDCAALPDGRIVFTAVAEDSRDSYNDGPCSAAAVGLVDVAGRVLQVGELDPLYKIEGVHAGIEEGTIRLLLVTDADDADVPAELLEAHIA